MNQDVLSLLNTLGGLPNWKYQLGVQQLQPQEQQIAANYQLGQQSLADQMAQFQQAQALAQAQQQWQQQFQTQGQQFGQQQTGAQNALANQSAGIQNAYLPQELLAQLVAQQRGGLTGSPNVPGLTRNPGQNQLGRGQLGGMPALSWTNPQGVTAAGWPTQ